MVAEGVDKNYIRQKQGKNLRLMDFLDKKMDFDMTAAEKEVDAAKHIFMIGTLGAGKSSISQTLFFDSYLAALKEETFKSSKSVAGFTQTFASRFSPYLRCHVTDSPGLGDTKIALPVWMRNFNK